MEGFAMARLIACLSLVALAPFAWAQVAPPEQGKEPQVHEGVVVTASADQVSLREANGKEHSFKTNEMTRVMINGKPGKLTDLKAGTPIRVMVDQVGKVTSVATVDDRKGR
jgi:hypothetical protein